MRKFFLTLLVLGLATVTLAQNPNHQRNQEAKQATRAARIEAPQRQPRTIQRQVERPAEAQRGHPSRQEVQRPPVQREINRQHQQEIRRGGGDRDDQRFRREGSFRRFNGGFGRRFRCFGGSPRRFRCGAFWFSVAEFEFDLCNDWFWDSDYIIIYQDNAHPGWCLAYNVRLRRYVHVIFIE